MSDITLELPEVMKSSRYPNAPKESMQSKIALDLEQVASLSREDQTLVEDFSRAIDLSDGETIIRYGEVVQKKLGNFTDEALKKVLKRDLSEVGDLLREIVSTIDEFSQKVAGQKRLPKFVRWIGGLNSLRVECEETVKSLERIKKLLDGWRMTLLVDVQMLDEMYQLILKHYKELTMYVLAGQQKLVKVRDGELKNLQQKAEVSLSQEDALNYNDFLNRCNIFEKRLQDLELTKTICLQTLTQILLTQDINRQLALNIQSGVGNTISLWQQNIATAIALRNYEERIIAENFKLLDMANQTLAMEEQERQKRILLCDESQDDE